MKKYLLALLLVIFSCGNAFGADSRIRLVPDSLNLNVGDNERLSTRTTDGSTSDYLSLLMLQDLHAKYAVDDSTIISIEDDDDGYYIVRAWKPGTTKVRVTLYHNSTNTPSGDSAECVVTVGGGAISIDLSDLGLVENTLTVDDGVYVNKRITGTPDGLVFSAQNMPSWLALTSDGLLQGTASGAGVAHKPTITATLPNGENNSVSFFVFVQKPESGLTIDLSELKLVDNRLVLKNKQAINLQITGTPSGLVYSATGLPEGISLTSYGHLYGSSDKNGTYTVTVRGALPSTNLSATRTFTIEINDQGSSSESDGGGGGCNSSFAGAAFLAVLAVLRKRR